MRYCSKCNRQHGDRLEVCPDCGSKLVKVSY